MKKPTETKDQDQNKDLQGEGNYDATRRYDKSAQEFAQSGKVEEAARAAQPGSAEEAKRMEQAEQVGKSHSKGEDPTDGMKTTPKKK